jgi:hypothetical protein
MEKVTIASQNDGFMRKKNTPKVAATRTPEGIVSNCFFSIIISIGILNTIARGKMEIK